MYVVSGPQMSLLFHPCAAGGTLSPIFSEQHSGVQTFLRRKRRPKCPRTSRSRSCRMQKQCHIPLKTIRAEIRKIESRKKSSWNRSWSRTFAKIYPRCWRHQKHSSWRVFIVIDSVCKETVRFICWCHRRRCSKLWWLSNVSNKPDSKWRFCRCQFAAENELKHELWHSRSAILDELVSPKFWYRQT